MLTSQYNQKHTSALIFDGQQNKSLQPPFYHSFQLVVFKRDALLPTFSLSQSNPSQGLSHSRLLAQSAAP